MAYTKTTWLEHSMTTQQKLDGLNNLEGLVGEAKAYIDALTHSTRYYTDAQAAALFFTAANDGTGSGLVAATLDGYTAVQIINSGTPSGSICWWSDSVASIPAGFYLCDGANGTPDLRDRFVVGAGSHYTKAETGGADTVTTTGTVTIAAHALIAAEIPKHTHGTITDYYPTQINSGVYVGVLHMTSTWTETTRTTGSAGSGSSHTHSATWTGTSNQDKRPPYYALCYIMKS